MIHRRLADQARFAPGALIAAIAFSLAGGGLIVAQAWAVSLAIDRAFLGGASLAELGPVLAFLLAVIGLRAGAAFGGEAAAARLALRVKTHLRSALFEHLLRLGPAYTESGRTAEFTTAAVEGVEALDAYFSQYLPQLVVSAVVPLAVLAVVAPLDPLSAVVLLLTAPLIPFFMSLIGKATGALTRQQYSQLGILSAHFLDVLQGLPTLKMLGQSRAQAAVVEKVADRYRAATMGVLRVAFLSALVLEIVATISTAIVAVEVGLRVLYGRMSFQPALFILILAPEFYIPLRALGLRFHAAEAGVAAARRIFEILNTPQPAAQREAGAGRSGGRAPSGWGRRLAFRDVHFAYGDGRAALNGLSFDVEAGQTVALVGPTGAGKSTATRLLLRFADPQRGQILVDGRPLDEIPAEEWRGLVAWVPQRPSLFHDTLAANIRLGGPDAGMEAVVRAAQHAHIHEFIQSLPQGYDTPIGEHGARLSAGQAQRVALARAFLKDSPLLVLDEPTSNIDPDLEEQLREATARLMAGRTVITIAHRMSTVYRADRIVVMDEGRAVETGTHAELLRAGGLYRRLVVVEPPQSDQSASSDAGRTPDIAP